MERRPVLTWSLRVLLLMLMLMMMMMMLCVYIGWWRGRGGSCCTQPITILKIYDG